MMNERDVVKISVQEWYYRGEDACCKEYGTDYIVVCPNGTILKHTSSYDDMVSFEFLQEVLDKAAGAKVVVEQLDYREDDLYEQFGEYD